MKSYASDKVSVIFNGTPITGLMDGTAVTVGRNVDSAAMHIGFGGEGTVVWSSDKSGIITLRLKQTSLSNAVLSAAEATRLVGPVIIKDTNGNSLHSGAKAVVSAMPYSEYAQELSVREWTIMVEALIHFEGGNPDV